MNNISSGLGSLPTAALRFAVRFSYSLGVATGHSSGSNAQKMTSLEGMT